MSLSKDSLPQSTTTTIDAEKQVKNSLKISALLNPVPTVNPTIIERPAKFSNTFPHGTHPPSERAPLNLLPQAGPPHTVYNNSFNIPTSATYQNLHPQIPQGKYIPTLLRDTRPAHHTPFTTSNSTQFNKGGLLAPNVPSTVINTAILAPPYPQYLKPIVPRARAHVIRVSKGKRVQGVADPSANSYARSPRLKLLHKISEQKRRAELRDVFRELEGLLRECGNIEDFTNISKTDIVDVAAMTIDQLAEELNSLSRERELLRMELKGI